MVATRQHTPAHLPPTSRRTLATSLEPPPPPLASPSAAQGRIRREGASEVAPEAVRQAVGGGCQSGWGRLLSVSNALKLALGVRGTVAWRRLGALEPPPPPPPTHPLRSPPPPPSPHAR